MVMKKSDDKFLFLFPPSPAKMADDLGLERIMQKKAERLKRELDEERSLGSLKQRVGQITVTDSSFNSVVLSSASPVLVDFWAEWCMPCKAMEPILEHAESKYGERIAFAKLNVDENPLTAGRYEVFGIPTFILFQGGAERDRIVGTVDGATMEEMLAPYMI